MALATTISASFQPLSSQAPVAAKKPRDVTVHGDKRIDDYFWLREKESAEVVAYLEKENEYTEAVLAPAKELREKLFKEMRGRIKEDDTSAKIPYLGYVYYTRTEKDKQYSIYCRAKHEAGALEEVLLDLNELGKGKPYVSVGDYRVSPDGTRLAYGIDWTGYRQFEVFVLDLNSKQFVPQKIGLVSNLDWSGSPDALYTVTENETKRSDKLHRWNLRTGTHEVLYEEKDELFNLDIKRSRDHRYMICEAQSKVSTEARVLRADDLNGEFTVLIPRENDHEYYTDFGGGQFYVISNKGAKNFRIITASESAPTRWTELIAHRPEVKIDGVDMFATHMVISAREQGLPQLEVFDLNTKENRRFELPDEVYETSGDQNWEYSSSEYRYRYQSLARPASVFASNLATGERRLIKQTEVLGGFSSADYEAKRVWVNARDGVRIPLSVVARKDVDLTKPQPLWVYGYGSYGLSMPITFSSARVSLLDRGVVFVIAHIRGGGELGEEWREAGRMETKETTFNDFVDCAQWLVDRRWTTPDQMVTSGGSAGGLLMGAVLNQRPDLFKAALLSVPFVDVVNTMLDATLPLTTEEYVEWGNPNILEEYGWIRAYSPYDNLKPAKYPHVMVDVSFHDSQVPYWEGAKYLAKLRTLNQGDTVSVLHTNMGAGHVGASGRFDALHDVARDYAFFLSALGIGN